MDEINYSELLKNCPSVYSYYDNDMNIHKIDYMLEVYEDDENIYVITLHGIVTLSKAAITTDKTIIESYESDKKDKEVKKWEKEQEKLLKELNKKIKKGTLKKKDKKRQQR